MASFIFIGVSGRVLCMAQSNVDQEGNRSSQWKPYFAHHLLTPLGQVELGKQYLYPQHNLAYGGRGAEGTTTIGTDRIAFPSTAAIDPMTIVDVGRSAFVRTTARSTIGVSQTFSP